MNKQKNEALRIISSELKKRLQEIKQSKRWIIGDKTISLVEKILGRKDVVLSIEKLEALINLLPSTTFVNEPKNPLKQIQNLIPNKNISFICSNDKIANTREGDVMTALELSTALNKNKAISSRLCHYQNEKHTHTDILISMIYHADIFTLSDLDRIPLKIAWIRNHTENWISSPWFNEFDIFLCSSNKIKTFISSISSKPCYLFPIATNLDRFSDIPINPSYQSDYVFTGNKWTEKRFLEKHWDPKCIDKKFAIYGKAWESVSKFKTVHRGDLDYDEIPSVYASTQIVIDDANETTKKWSSVNSRVFDAIASKKLVISSNANAVELLGSTMPIFINAEQLQSQLEQYFTDEAAYKKTVDELYEKVSTHHTYDIRAQTLIDIINKHEFPSYDISIAIAVSESEELFNWGDFHFAQSLKNALEYFGSKVSIAIHSEWKNISPDDIVIVLEGLKKYHSKSKEQKVLHWLISHPELFSATEYRNSHKLYVASKSYFEKIQHEVSVPTEYLAQFGDSDLFFPIENITKSNDILFVGNHRSENRPAITFAAENKLPLKVIGQNWNHQEKGIEVIDSFAEYHVLNKYYQENKLVVIDHWEQMRKEGFISNKVYNLLLSKADFITDEIPNSFNQELKIYKDSDSFLKQSKIRMAPNVLEELRAEILSKHTHYHRAYKILRDIATH